MKRVLILGGGVGGVIAAKQLAGKLGGSHQITLIDKSAKHYFQPGFLGIMTGRLGPESTGKELKNIERPGLLFVNEEITEIDAENQKVKTPNNMFEYDYLVVALGAQLAPEKVPGLKEAGFTPYQKDSAVELRDKIRNFNGGKIAVLVSSMPYKCPAAPYETAFLVDAIFRSKGIRKKAVISIYTPEGQPMPTAGPEAGTAIKGLLESRDIGFYPGLTVSLADQSQKRILLNSDEKAEFDLLIYVPPHKAPDVIANSPLAGETGWIPADPKTLKTRFENVFAIGDVTAIKLPGVYKPDMPLSLPKAGVFAHEQAKIVAGNIASEIEDKSALQNFDGHGACFLETGMKKAGFARGDFYAMPNPIVNMRPPEFFHYLNKMIFEKYWLWTKP